MIKIEETKDYEMLVPFLIENELEFSIDDDIPTDIVKCWKAEEDGQLVGACVLAKRNGEFICDGIAISPAIRGQGYGERMLELLINETKERNGNKVFLVARAPSFFASQGFVSTPKDDAPIFFECFTCPQYGNGCNPEVMRLDI